MSADAKNNLSLSIVIPALNEEHEIGGLLDRLAQQDYNGSLEIIVVDGHSSDRTREIVREHSEVILLEAGPGVAAQRNAGAAAASGTILVFMDADNAPKPDFLRRVVAIYDRTPFAVACPWFVPRTWRPDIHLFYNSMNNAFFLSQYRFHTGAGVCIVTPRSIFEQVGGFDVTLHLGEDVDYIQRAALLGAHRHLLVPLRTSARRAEVGGLLRLILFYIRISPALLTQDREALRRFSYPVIRRSPR